MLERLRRIADLRGCAVLIGSGSNAELFAGLDEGRLARARPIEYQRAWIRAVMGREIAWSIVAYPTERWASEIFGSPEVERLWEAASHVLRLDDPDPVEAWNRRFEQLESRAAQLTERRFDALRYRGPGTDLEVGLIAGARWLAGRSRTLDGHLHGANLPTEEVFTSPHRLRAEGTIRSSLPLALGGTKVDGLELRLAGGEIVEVHARSIFLQGLLLVSPVFASKLHMSMSPRLITPGVAAPLVNVPPSSPGDTTNAPGALARLTR